MKKLSALPVLFASSILAPAAFAQSVLFEDLAVPSAFAPPEGRMLGSFKLDAEIGTGVLSTNNVYRDNTHLGSEASQTGLTTTLTSQSDKHLVIGTFEYFSQNFRDNAYRDLDIDAQTTTVFGRFVTSQRTNLRLLVIDEEDILGKDQSDQLNSFTSGLEHNRRLEAIFEFDTERYFANIMARDDQVDSESFSRTATAIQDEALDRSERDYIVLAGRSFPWGRAFVFAGTQEVRYESGSIPTLSQRNSDEDRQGFGIEYEVGRFSGDADIFRFTQRFVSAAIPDIEGEWVGSGTLNYAASDRLTLMASAQRRFHETNIAGSGGIFSEDVFIGASVALLPGLYLRMGPSYNRADIQNTPVRIERYELDLELGWQLSKHFQLLFTNNIFIQEPTNPAFTNFDAQQANSVLSVKYLL